jgi:hypothetical protein
MTADMPAVRSYPPFGFDMGVEDTKRDQLRLAHGLGCVPDRGARRRCRTGTGR